MTAQSGPEARSTGGSPAPSTGTADFVVVANRLPIDMIQKPDGTVEWKRSPGGLVTALEPLLRRRHGAWIGWPGVPQEPGDPNASEEPIEQDGMSLVRVRLSADDVAKYYEGFSNGTLWPLYHDVIVKPIYHREWWDRYVEVNRRFAEATARVAAEGATVWVQDYQLQLVPKMLRELRPDLTIGFFLHIPFPNPSDMPALSERKLMPGWLASFDLIGLQTRRDVSNALDFLRDNGAEILLRGKMKY